MRSGRPNPKLDRALWEAPLVVLMTTTDELFQLLRSVN